jgi:hypothetical protein
MRYRVGITAIAAVLMLPASTLAEKGSLIRLEARDSGGRVAALVCGVHSSATYGFDKEFSEIPLPPPPPVPTLEIRFLDPGGRKQYPYEASYVDVRGYRGPSQLDTFYVRYQADPQDYPLVMRWDPEISARFRRSSIMAEGQPGTRVNMQQLPSFTIAAPGRSTVMIILEGPRPVDLPLPIDTNRMRFPNRQ